VLEEGTANSHVSIVARALGIPAVGEIPNAPGIADPGDAIIVDGTSGSIYIRLGRNQSAYAERCSFAPGGRRNIWRCATSLRHQRRPADRAHDQCRPVIDLPHIDDTGSPASGCSHRAAFMVGQSLPRTSDQLRCTARCWTPPAKPVTFRTLDIGGDRRCLHGNRGRGEPALGWRAIRLGLDVPGCCAARSARCCAPAAAARCASCFR
jgi:phosphotransferase system enzyme I (PtsP)